MKKIAFILLLFFILFCWNAAFAQKQGQAKIDSLQAVLKTAKEDTNKVNALNALANELSRANLDTCVIISMQALQLAEKIKWQLGIGKSHQRLGNFLDNKGNYGSSFEHYTKALAICDELEKSGISPESEVISLKSKTLGNIGIVYFRQDDYSKAMNYFSSALKMAEEAGDKQTQAANLINIGNVYDRQGDYPRALDYDFKSLKIVEELDLKNDIAANLINIGVHYNDQGYHPQALEYYLRALKMEEELGDKVGISKLFNNIGNVYIGEGDNPKALEYYFKALKMAEELRYKQLQAKALGNIGIVYANQGDYPKALVYDFKALKLAEELGYKNGTGAILSDIGDAYVKQNKLKNAYKFLHDALRISTEIGDLERIRDENESLSELYSKTGDWKNAYDYYKQFLTIRDRLKNEERAKKETRLEMNYEFERMQAADSAKHEKQMAVANVENNRQKLFRNVSIGGFSVMLLFAGVFFTQRNRISKGKKRSDELLLNILPSQTAEELKATGTAKAKSYDMVTVLFTDFKNFTQASEKMSAEELVGEINHCYSEFDKIISKHGIEKIKTIGDSYMCAGGLPVENKTNPIEVVQAALEIQQFIAREKEDRQNNNKPFFEIRIGINTGSVVAGIVGIKKFAYDIWGDTVNIASRMESSGETGKVNISGSTYELVKDKFTCIHRGKIDAKNKGMIDMYFVEGATKYV